LIEKKREEVEEENLDGRNKNGRERRKFWN